MRNLKKILALVLALVMSLSLMATASATEFPDDGEIDDTYRVAVEVLSGLNVFAGDQNGKFNPKDPIRRSEVAAIIYRIATGDVTNERNNSYTPYNQFSDVITGDWFAGYVTYCANAGYIKGRNDGKFDPYANVTGYEVLAMILRAVGYDKNNEFVGSNWQLNTASIAQQKGVLGNITGTTKLSEPATRETVAELLFRSILLPKVTWNANSLSYTDGTTPLATETLGLEEITGVVMANQWADLENSYVMAEGKTRLKVDGEDYTIDYTSALTDIGESRHAYIQGSKVFVLDGADLNDVRDNEGAETDVVTLSGGLNTSNAENYRNFDLYTWQYCEQRIEFNLRFTSDNTNDTTKGLGKFYVETGVTREILDLFMDRDEAAETGDVVLAYEKVIPATEYIDPADLMIMEAIFKVASDIKQTWGIDGSVYVGTRSGAANDVSNDKDISNDISYATFEREYILTDDYDITDVGNGNWLKIIDNNGDGKAEYVLLTVYTLDKVVNSATKNDTTTYYYQGLNLNRYTPVYLDGYSPAVGDIVLYAEIDGTAQMHLADSDSKAFRAVNYKERQATDTEGTTWEQSDIDNDTLLPEELTDVNENVTYTIYLDDYGYVRAYDNKTTYALVTEVYPTNYMNQAWLTGHNLTAEVMTAEDAVLREYSLVNSWYAGGWNPFFIGTNEGWFYEGINDGFLVNQGQTNVGRPNYLTHATGGLDINRDWENLFTYSDKAPTNNYHPYSWTNVAKYTLTDDGINLNSAAEITYNSDNTIREIEDYVQLKIDSVSPSDPLYEIEDTYWNGLGDDYVRAVDDTEFFVVAKEGTIRHYTGYTNVPALTVKDNGIRAMYAVAETTNYDRDGASYWVANVIVIEIDHFNSTWDSVALIYGNEYKISGDVKYLQAIDSKRGDIGIIPNNETWQGQFTNRGFYALSNVVATETEGLYRADIVWLRGESGPARSVDPNANLYGTYGIHYGVVRSFNGELTRSSYITVDECTSRVGGEPVYGYTKTIRLAGDYASVWGIDGTNNRANTALDLILDYHANKQVQVGDEIVWVETGSGSAGFVVDLTSSVANGYGGRNYRNWNTPAWLCTWNDNDVINGGEVRYVVDDQINVYGAPAKIGTFYGETFTSTYAGGEFTVPYTTAEANYDDSKNMLTLNTGYTLNTNVTPNWPGAPVREGARYEVTVKDTAGNLYTFYLVQGKAETNVITPSEDSLIENIDTTGEITVKGDPTIEEFTNNVKNDIDENATITWEFYNENGELITDTAGKKVSDADSWYAVVTGEDGTPNVYYSKTDGEPAVVVTANRKEGVTVTDPNPATEGIVVEAGEDGTYTVKVTSEDEPVAVVGNTVYQMTQESAARAAGTTWSVTLTMEQLNISADMDVVVVIYIRAKTDADKPVAPGEDPTPSNITVTVNDAGKDILTLEGSTLTVNEGKTVSVAGVKTYLTITPEGAEVEVKRGEATITSGNLVEGDKIVITSGADKKELTVKVAATEPGEYTVTLSESSTHMTFEATWDETGTKLESIKLIPDDEYKVTAEGLSITMGEDTVNPILYDTTANSTTGELTITFTNGDLTVNGDVTVTATASSWQFVTVTLTGADDIIATGIGYEIQDASGTVITPRVGDTLAAGTKIVITAPETYTLTLKAEEVQAPGDDGLAPIDNVTTVGNTIRLSAAWDSANHITVTNAFAVATTNQITVTVNGATEGGAVTKKFVKGALNQMSIDLTEQLAGKRVTIVSATMGDTDIKDLTTYDKDTCKLSFNSETVATGNITVELNAVTDIERLNFTIDSREGVVPAEEGGLDEAVYVIVADGTKATEGVNAVITKGGEVAVSDVLEVLGVTGEPLESITVDDLAAAEAGSYLVAYTQTGEEGSETVTSIGCAAIPEMIITYTLSITLTGKHMTSTIPTAGKTIDKGEKLSLKQPTITLTLDDGYDVFPATVTITMEGRDDPLAQGTDYSYNKDTGVISFQNSELTMDGNISISFTDPAAKYLKEATVTLTPVEPGQGGDDTTYTIALDVEGEVSIKYVVLTTTMTAEDLKDVMAQWTSLTTADAIAASLSNSGFADAETATEYSADAKPTLADEDGNLGEAVLVIGIVGEGENAEVTYIGYKAIPAPVVEETP